MALHTFFPTFIYTAGLDRRTSPRLNSQLLIEAEQMREDDVAGRRWSSKNYPSGYTSYASSHRLQHVSPTFQLLQKKLDRHVAAFVTALEWDLTGRRLEMTDCWINIMHKGAVHGLHLHPLATVSGTYYVKIAKGSPGIKFEDPRLDRYMAAPPRLATARRENRPWIVLPAVAGQLVLFESWLRHEVAPNPVASERVSVSFNYNWF